MTKPVDRRELIMSDEVAKNGGGELSQAEKLAFAESLKAEQAEKFKQRKAAKAEFALADATAKTTLRDLSKPGANVVPIKRDVLMVASSPAPKEEPKEAKAEEPKAESKSASKEEPKAEAIKLKAEGAKLPTTRVRSGFSLRTFTFKEARTSFEKSLAALRTFGISFSYDKFRNQLLVGGHALKQLVGESIEHHILLLRAAVNDRYGWEAKPEVTKAAVVRLCLEHSFNPVLDYLDTLIWDGKPRLDTWLSVYLGAANDPLNRAIGRKTLIAGARRVREPGTKFDQIVVLEGPQGTGKSTALIILAGEDYHSDAEILGQSGREVMEQTTGIWIYEISELEGIGKRDVAHVKAFARRQFDRARPAYGHALERRGRTCIFIGTTNSKDYLADETGNRSFWPVVTGEIDLDALARDRDQLWAEAVVAEATGETLVIDRALWGEAAAVVGERLPDDPWQDILSKVENMPNAGGSLERAEGYIKVTSEFLLNGVLCISPVQVNQNHTKRLARVMERLGWKKPPNIRIGAIVAKGYLKMIE